MYKNNGNNYSNNIFPVLPNLFIRVSVKCKSHLCTNGKTCV